MIDTCIFKILICENCTPIKFALSVSFVARSHIQTHLVHLVLTTTARGAAYLDENIFLLHRNAKIAQKGALIWGEASFRGRQLFTG